MELPEIAAAAKAHGVHPSAICLKWLVQHGSVPIPFSVKEPQIYSNLKSVTEDPLTDEEMSLISAADKDCRLVKGQVFLWEGASGWQELWV
jgi:diketogulonate reductase-like aldo/keto reductase